MRSPIYYFVLFALLILMTACASSQTDGEANAAKAMEMYLEAMTGKNEDGVIRSVCPEWESDALLEFDAFALVETALDGLVCQQSGTDGSAVLVTCQGKIKASYVNEIQEFDLSQRTYRLVQHDQDWLICGYTIK